MGRAPEQPRARRRVPHPGLRRGVVPPRSGPARPAPRGRGRLRRDRAGGAGRAGARRRDDALRLRRPGRARPHARFCEAYDGLVRRARRAHDLHPLPPALREPRAGARERRARAAWRTRRPGRSPPGDDLLAGMHSMHRRGARKAERAGVEVSFATAPPDARRVRRALRRDDAPSRRGGATTASATTTGRRSTRSASRLVRGDARLDGELLSSMLLLANEDAPPWLHYHLGATAPRGFELGASKLLFLRAAEWGRAQGFEELHLGSGLGGEENSLWQFKQRFSPHPGREFWLGKAVHDEAAYRELTGRTDTDGLLPGLPRVIGRVVFWASLGALAWTHAGYPLAASALARRRPRPVRRADRHPERDADRPRARRGGRDRRAAREPPRARLPGGAPRDHRRLGRLHRPHGRARRGGRPARAPRPARALPARREARHDQPAPHRGLGRDPRLHGREHELGARRARASSSAPSPTRRWPT